MVLSAEVLRTAAETSAPEPLRLLAGEMTMEFEPHSGFLRYLRAGGREVLRGIYAAVRDRNWDTVPPQVSNLHIEQREGGFRLDFDVVCRQGEIDFRWHGQITGTAEGQATYRMRGQAHSSFYRNRIGFCILHSADAAGARCSVERTDGSVQHGHLPQAISPHQPFKQMRAMTHEVAPGLSAQVRVDGDVFEMEDQRNWTDGSYKTYCTPLELPFPVEVTKGTVIEQAVTVRLQGAPPGNESDGASEEVRFDVSEDVVGALPAIGLGISSEPASAPQVQRLQALHLSHLRVDLWLKRPEHRALLRCAAGEAAALGAGLEIAIYLSDSAEAELADLAAAMRDAKPKIARWLVFDADRRLPPVKWFDRARRVLKQIDPQAPVGSGTDAYFAELNRNHPPTDAIDFLTYSINPQVHAFDNASLVETLEAQASTVHSAKKFSNGKPIVVSPVTLRPRFNPNATGPEPEPKPGELPSGVDPRQMSLFCAGWTAGSIKYLAEAGAQSVTYYQTTGMQGVIESDGGSPLPKRFPSIPGGVFPVYHVLADIGELAGGQVLQSASSQPLEVDGIVLQRGNLRRTVLANLGRAPRRVRIQGLGGNATIRLLDENNAEQAMRSPEAWRAQRAAEVHRDGKDVVIELRPSAVARIDERLSGR